MRFLWRFFRRRFLRLWVAILLRFRFFPEPIPTPVDAASATDRLRLVGLFQHERLELAAGLEDGHELRGDQHFRAAARVARPAGAALPDLERSEAPDLEVLAVAERAADGIEQSIHDDRGVIAGDPR